MSDEDIIALAKEAAPGYLENQQETFIMNRTNLLRFAAMVISRLQESTNETV